MGSYMHRQIAGRLSPDIYMLPSQSDDQRRVIIIGAGPAGLTAAYTLSKRGVPATVLEADRIVGGIARTVNYKGFLFDIGGHRFFTKWDRSQSDLERDPG